MKDAERIRDFILEHRPHVVMVGTTNLHCKQLHADLRSILDHILEHHPQFITRSETGDVDIVYADETLAALWQTSAAAEQEMGDQPPLVRRAVSNVTMSEDPILDNLLASHFGVNVNVRWPNDSCHMGCGNSVPQTGWCFLTSQFTWLMLSYAAAKAADRAPDNVQSLYKVVRRAVSYISMSRIFYFANLYVNCGSPRCLQTAAVNPADRALETFGMSVEGRTTQLTWLT